MVRHLNSEFQNSLYSRILIQFVLLANSLLFSGHHCMTRAVGCKFFGRCLLYCPVFFVFPGNHIAMWRSVTQVERESRLTLTWKGTKRKSRRTSASRLILCTSFYNVRAVCRFSLLSLCVFCRVWWFHLLFPIPSTFLPSFRSRSVYAGPPPVV